MRTTAEPAEKESRAHFLRHFLKSSFQGSSPLSALRSRSDGESARLAPASVDTVPSPASPEVEAQTGGPEGTASLAPKTAPAACEDPTPTTDANGERQCPAPPRAAASASATAESTSASHPTGTTLARDGHVVTQSDDVLADRALRERSSPHDESLSPTGTTSAVSGICSPKSAVDGGASPRTFGEDDYAPSITTTDVSSMLLPEAVRSAGHSFPDRRESDTDSDLSASVDGGPAQLYAGQDRLIVGGIMPGLAVRGIRRSSVSTRTDTTLELSAEGQDSDLLSVHDSGAAPSRGSMDTFQTQIRDKLEDIIGANSASEDEFEQRLLSSDLFTMPAGIRSSMLLPAWVESRTDLRASDAASSETHRSHAEWLAELRTYFAEYFPDIDLSSASTLAPDDRTIPLPGQVSAPAQMGARETSRSITHPSSKSAAEIPTAGRARNEATPVTADPTATAPHAILPALDKIPASASQQQNTLAVPQSDRPKMRRPPSNTPSVASAASAPFTFNATQGTPFYEENPAPRSEKVASPDATPRAAPVDKAVRRGQAKPRGRVDSRPRDEGKLQAYSLHINMLTDRK
ncbi:unnamed protein product [Parajaminaea phylloscopi]